MRKRDEAGVALLTVLLLVAVISALAVAVLEDIRFALRRTGNAEAIGQAQWYALGAETLARARLAQLAGADPSIASAWNGEWLNFPIDNGVMRVRIADATLCFNLNSVVEGAAEQWRHRPLGLQQFVALLLLSGVPEQEARGLAEKLADWIDSDLVRNTMGGEDDLYNNGARPYRTSGTLLGEVSELRAIRGFTPDIYARIRPHVCALPTADLSPVNVNLLGEDDAVLLAALLDGKLQQEQAARLIAARPASGWKSVEEFWLQPGLASSLPDDPVLAQISLEPRFLSLEAEVAYAGSEVVMTSLFERPANGPVRLAARRWTLDE
jgi:general secretion pathway protein K